MRPLANILITLAILNFAAFVIVASLVGGSAFNGKVEAGKFYLGNSGHYTEVTPSTFKRIKCHEYSQIGTIALAMFGGFLNLRENRKHRLSGVTGSVPAT